MKTLLICSELLENQLKKLQHKYNNVQFIETTCTRLDESGDVVFKLPEMEFYHHVPEERIGDIIVGACDDLKIQTARLFSVEMKMYVSEYIYRKVIKELHEDLQNIEDFSVKHLRELIEMYSVKYNLKEIDIMNAIKMALIKTTYGPNLFDLYDAMDQKMILNNLKNHFRNYRYRV